MAEYLEEIALIVAGLAVFLIAMAVINRLPAIIDAGARLVFGL